MKRVLVGGAESAVGAEVVAALARRPEVERIGVVLAAPAGGGGAAAGALRRRAERLAGWAAGEGADDGRLEPIEGDPAAHRFGLDPGGWEALAAGGWQVGLNLGGAAGLDCDLAAARRAHLDPVDGWVALLERAPGLRLVQLSSCLVGGRRRGLLTEFDLDGGAGFRNGWERSRSEAERRLAESPVRGRVTVVRPSHPVGRAADGAVWAPPAIYPLLAALAGAGWLPGDPEARLDLVPVDWVARALVALAGEPEAAGGTFHLVAGWGRSVAAGALARRVAEAAGRRRPVRLAPLPAAPLLGALDGARSGGRRAARDYLRQGPVFDDFMASRALAGLGVEPPPAAAEAVAAAVRYAAGRNWDPARFAGGAGPQPPSPPARRRPRLLLSLDGRGGSAAAEAAASPVAPAAPAAQQAGGTRFRQVGDYRVAYRDGGGDGEPVVFLHGFAGAGSWDGVVERLAGRYRCLVVETLGLGDTEAAAGADFGLAAQAAMVRGLLAGLGLERVRLVGNDTGGALAQIIAARWPQCLERLVLSDCDAYDNWPSRQVAALRAVMRLPGGTAALTAAMRLAPVARSRWGFSRMVHDRRLLTAERLAGYLAPVAADGVRRARLRRFFLALDPAATGDVVHLLRRLEVPTLIVWGAEDRYWSTSWAARLYDEIPGARRLAIIPFAGLSCHEERPDLFARHLLDFFADPAPPRG